MCFEMSVMFVSNMLNMGTIESDTDSQAWGSLSSTWLPGYSPYSKEETWVCPTCRPNTCTK